MMIRIPQQKRGQTASELNKSVVLSANCSGTTMTKLNNFCSEVGIVFPAMKNLKEMKKKLNLIFQQYQKSS